MSPKGISPSTAVDTSDNGDEVQRRYRYQINYSALKALQLLVSSTDIRAVYCEKIEDLLVEQVDGSFVGIQIKSRELDQDPFKASDPTIVAALARFCRRDHEFPGWFALFVIATNFVFDECAGARNLRNILACARKNPKLASVSSNDKFRKYFEKLARDCQLTVDSVIATLGKVVLEERKTGIDQPDLEVVQALGQVDGYQQLRMDQLMAAARMLRTRIWEASSLAIGETVLQSHKVTPDFQQVCQQLRDASKCIDRNVMTKTLAEASSIDTAGELLAISGYLAREKIPPGLGRMELKMAAGSIAYAEIDQMKDDVASLDGAFLRWKEREGLAEANRRLAHFQYLAIRDARIAQNQVETVTTPYGQAMLADFRLRAKRTHELERSTLFGCRVEHLIGAAGLLTEECKLWWGKPIPIEGRDEHST